MIISKKNPVAKLNDVTYKILTASSGPSKLMIFRKILLKTLKKRFETPNYEVERTLGLVIVKWFDER